MAAHGILHLLALLLTAAALCVHGRGRWAGLGAGALMLVAMTDVAFVGLVSPVAWTALLLVAGIALAAARSARRPRVVVAGAASEGVCVVTHDALGLVAMAALLPLMHAAGGADAGLAGGAATGAHAGHSAGIGVLVAVVLAVASAHVAGSIIAFARTRAGRAPYLLMGGATGMMALAAFA